MALNITSVCFLCDQIIHKLLSVMENVKEDVDGIVRLRLCLLFFCFWFCWHSDLHVSFFCSLTELNKRLCLCSLTIRVIMKVRLV